jgi:hypothetical protein
VGDLGLGDLVFKALAQYIQGFPTNKNHSTWFIVGRQPKIFPSGKIFMRHGESNNGRTQSNIVDEDMTHRVLTSSIPSISQERSPLKGYMKPARPNTLTWSRRQETLCKS